MRIAFLSQRSWPSIGGIENYQWHVARELASAHAVTIVSERVDGGVQGRLDGVLRLPPRFDEIHADGVTVRQLRLSHAQRACLLPLLVDVLPGTRRLAYGRARRATGALFAAVAQRAVRDSAGATDVVHIWAGDRLALAGVRAARALGARVVITPFAHAGQWGDDPASGAAYRAADLVFGLLEADAATYRKLGVPEHRLRICGVCSPGVTGSPSDGVALRRRHAISGALVVFLGVRRPHKGVELLLAAGRRLRALVPDATIAFVGPGAPIHGSSDGVRVIDAGRVDDGERAAWLHAADLMCLPSDGEIFPVSILESWSARTPVVTSDIPALVELTSRSGGGVAVALDSDALAARVSELLQRPDELLARGEAGHRFWASGHTPAAIAARYADAYAEVLE